MLNLAVQLEPANSGALDIGVGSQSVGGRWVTSGEKVRPALFSFELDDLGSTALGGRSVHKRVSSMGPAA